jgi:hypothetical protein
MIVQPIVSSIVSPIAQSIGTGSGGGGVVPSGETIYDYTIAAGDFRTVGLSITLSSGAVTWTYDGPGSPSNATTISVDGGASEVHILGTVDPSGVLETATFQGAGGAFVQIPAGVTTYQMTEAQHIDFSGVTIVVPASMTLLNINAVSAPADPLTNAPSFAGTALEEVSLFGLGCVGWDGGAIPASLTSLELTDQALTEATVDAILVALVTAGASGGYVDMSGGTSAAPGAAGLAAKTTLEGLGWTVAVNP